MARPKTSERRTDRNLVFTQQEVAEELGICRQTVAAYSKLAIFRVAHYRELMTLDGRVRTRKPLIPYQKWVLRKIKAMYDAFPSGLEAAPWIDRFLKINPELLDYDAYIEEQSNANQDKPTISDDCDRRLGERVRSYSIRYSAHAG